MRGTGEGSPGQRQCSVRWWRTHGIRMRHQSRQMVLGTQKPTLPDLSAAGALMVPFSVLQSHMLLILLPAVLFSLVVKQAAIYHIKYF